MIGRCCWCWKYFFLVSSRVLGFQRTPSHMAPFRGEGKKYKKNISCLYSFSFLNLYIFLTSSAGLLLLLLLVLFPLRHPRPVHLLRAGEPRDDVVGHRGRLGGQRRQEDEGGQAPSQGGQAVQGDQELQLNVRHTLGAGARGRVEVSG